MQEAYFKDIRSQIIAHLQKSSTKVSIAMAWFTSAELFGELIKCLHRGVRVSLVLLESPINFMEYAPDFNEFIKFGGYLHIVPADFGLMHHKFCIIDDEIVITGSYNWTYYAEIRNNENIIITDDKKIVSLFNNEFNRFIQNVNKLDEAPRYSWESLESMENVDFADVNYEIEQLSQIYHKPVRKLFETKTQVIVSEIRNTPKSAYNIGIWARDNEQEDVFEIIIPKDVELPFSSKNHILYFNGCANKLLVTHIIYGEVSQSCNDINLLKEEDFNEISDGIHIENLQLHYSMTLDINGDLKMEVYCKESGRKKIITLLNHKFVKYE